MHNLEQERGGQQKTIADTQGGVGGHLGLGWVEKAREEEPFWKWAW